MATKRQIKKNANSKKLCALCGNPLPRDIERRAIGRTGRGVCADCIELSGKLISLEKEASCENGGIITPARLIKLLDKAIIGQDSAKRAMAVALWKQQLRSRGVDVPNAPLLIYGPTGCGKTALAKEAAKLCGLPFMTFDATTLTEAGYKGMDASEMVIEMAAQYGEQKASAGVIFIDEFDKLAAKGSESRQSHCRGTQHTLLTLAEGTLVEGTSTENILFIFSGAFSGLVHKRNIPSHPIGFARESVDNDTPQEITAMDFIRYGIEPELMGRIQRLVAIEQLSYDEMRRVLRESSLSVFGKYERFFKDRGGILLLDPEQERLFLQKAVEKGLGARGLNSLIEEWVEPKLMELSEVHHGE